VGARQDADRGGKRSAPERRPQRRRVFQQSSQGRRKLLKGFPYGGARELRHGNDSMVNRKLGKHTDLYFR